MRGEIASCLPHKIGNLPIPRPIAIEGDPPVLQVCRSCRVHAFLTLQKLQTLQNTQSLCGRLNPFCAACGVPVRSSMNQPRDPSETLPFDPHASISTPSSDENSYLLVVQGTTSRRVQLPGKGAVVIGRDGHADLDLNDGSTSRRHACIEIDASGLRISDLGSRNGTRVNGELVLLPRELFTGDVITICSVSLIVHRGIAAQRRSVFGDREQLRERLETDLARARRFRHPLTVLDLDLRNDSSQRPAIEAALAPLCEPIDFAAWPSDSQVVVILPGQSAADGRALAQRAFAALGPAASELRVGSATYPEDAIEASLLLGAAHAAAQKARPCSVVAASDAFELYRMGRHRAIIADPSMQELYQLVLRLAKTEYSVLVLGQRGTGKELVALALHHYSPQRCNATFKALNCAAIPTGLADSELFGHKKGAFSGAVQDRAGIFEETAGGTVFLDEIGELPGDLQAKLLRTLQERTVRRLGDNHDRPIDVRIVAATNRPVDDADNDGFRRDLYDRLNAMQVFLLPLCQRKRELPILARLFLEEACRRAHRDPLTLSHGAYERLHSYAWPGNVRELESVMTRISILVGEEAQVVDPSHLDHALRMGTSSSSLGPPREVSRAAPDAPPPELARNSLKPQQAQPQQQSESSPHPLALGKHKEVVRESEIKLMVAALRETQGVITRAAKLIEMKERTFFKKLNDYRINVDALIDEGRTPELQGGKASPGDGPVRSRSRPRAK